MYFNFLFVLNFFLPIFSTYKILLLPTPFVSHMNYFEPLAVALKEAGHEPYIVLNDAFKTTQKLIKKKINILTYNGNGVCRMNTNQFYKTVTDSMIDSGGDPGVLGKIVAPAVAEECHKFLMDEELLVKAKKLDFHLAVVDGLFFARCLYIFPTELKIPFVTLTTFQDFWKARVPALPSFVPFHYSSFGEKMTFGQRFLNLFINIVFAISTSSPPLSNEIRTKFKTSSDDFANLITKSKLWFYNTDVIIDYAKPTLPNIIHVGGLGLRKAKPLSDHLEAFISSSNNYGVIIVCFGSVISQLYSSIIEKLIASFQQLPDYKFIWRLPNATKYQLPANVLALDWIPQSDLLGHKDTKAFITHCGNNGQFEAVFNAVPMIGLPIFADQIYNAGRISSKNYGIQLSMHTFTSERLIEAVKRLVNNVTIKESVEKASRLLHDRRNTASETAIFWIEHVIKYGDEHLRSYGVELPWYQYLLLDVLLAYFIIISVAVLFLFKLAKFVVKKFILGGKKRSKTE